MRFASTFPPLTDVLESVPWNAAAGRPPLLERRTVLPPVDPTTRHTGGRHQRRVSALLSHRILERLEKF
jgi:hypothetical protein